MTTDLKLSDALVRGLGAPESGNKITYEHGKDAIRGLGVRVTKANAKSFVMNYTIDGRERRYTIGAYPGWTVAAARDEARRLRQDIDRGVDPLGERITKREAPTVNDLCDRYIAEHAARKRTGSDDELMIRRIVKPELGNRKVASITFSDIDRLHRKITKENGPYQANRALALLSKMFALAIRWEMRTENPCKGVQRNDEEKRERYLSGKELLRLTEALAAYKPQSTAQVVRLLLLTGARLTEVLGATWDQFNLEAIDESGKPKPTWTKLSAHTKQKKLHHVPLSAPALQLLVEMRAEAERPAEKQQRAISPYLFPARPGSAGRHVTDIKKGWLALCKAAALTETVEKTDRNGKPILGKDGKPVLIERSTLRRHDLRHSYASVLVSAGLSLPIIGALLGHTQPGTTARYAHLFDDPLRAGPSAWARSSPGRATRPRSCRSDGGEHDRIHLRRCEENARLRYETRRCRQTC